MKETLDQILSAENSGRLKLEEAKEQAKTILQQADIKCAEILTESTKNANLQANQILVETEIEAKQEKLQLKQSIDKQWHKYKDNKDIIESAAEKIIDFILP